MLFLQRLHKSVIWSMFVGRSFIDKVIDALVDTIHSNRDDDNDDDIGDDGHDGDDDNIENKEDEDDAHGDVDVGDIDDY